MTLHAIEAQIETSFDKRRRRRHTLNLEIEARTSESQSKIVTVYDISDTGLLIETEKQFTVGETIEVNLPSAGPRRAKVVWASGHLVGCKFLQDLTRGEISAARLGGKFPVQQPAVLTEKIQVAPTQSDVVSSKEFSPSARLWLIIGLATTSWGFVGAVTLWLM